MQTIVPDVRITYAAEYLRGARKVKPDMLPPSVMVREIAELRRQLGIVLDVIDGQAETPAAIGHEFTRPGQVAAHLPAPDACMVCGLPEASHGGAVLSAADLATVQAGLTDATDLLTQQASLVCDNCDDSADDLCDTHAAGLDSADAYRLLAQRLGGSQ